MTTGKSTVNGGDGGGDSQKPPAVVGRIDTVRVAVLLVGVLVSCLVVLYMPASPIGSLPLPFSFSSPLADSSLANYTSTFDSVTYKTKLERILREASVDKNRPMIITTLNRAWTEPNSTFDLFLESFHVGEGTDVLLRRLVVACMDPVAYNRCSEIQGHHHCYFLRTEGMDFSSEQPFMSPDYLKMMWRRIEFLGFVLQLGYSFLFTDADIMWLRDPFPRLYSEVDFQIACDRFNGNPKDIRNDVNGGFTFVQSNKRTIKFYKFWYYSRLRFPGSHDQDVFDRIKRDPFITKIGLRMRFLDTAYFGGFCQPSGDLDLVHTMHANCCIGLENKVRDLRQVLDVWRKYLLATQGRKKAQNMNWGVFENCRKSMGH